jgi:hypothetical protein
LKPTAGNEPIANQSNGSIPLPNTVKQKIKDGIVALTVAVWCFLRPWSHLVFDANRYFHKLPVTRTELLAMLVNICGLAALIWIGIRIWRHTQSRALIFILDLLFIGLLVFPLDYIRVQCFRPMAGGADGFFRSPLAILAMIVVLVILLWKHRLVARIVAMVLCVTFPAVLWTLCRMVLLCLNLIHLRECTQNPTNPPLLPAREGQPRVVWIIFDETDYRLVFEKRPPDVLLPEFDRLRLQSLFATNAYPPGGATRISMPALITGRRLASVAHDDCDLALTPADSGPTMDWSATSNIFSTARSLGFNTALVGWYHPYGRILGGSLNYCSWYPYPAFEQARAATFGESIQEQIEDLTGHFSVRQHFIRLCQDSLQDSLSLVTNSTYGLILLHLPPPHAPGVYLPATDGFTSRGIALPRGYFNNLVLADHELGLMRRAMESAAVWDKTWVILSADHWWRESQTYDGLVDHRVPFVLKSGGGGEPLVYGRQFNTVVTSDLILAILRGQVNNLAGAAKILDANKSFLPEPAPGEGAE